MTASPLLSTRNLHAYYGKSHILQGVDLDLGKGEVVSLLGRNGSGRSTLMKTIMGLVPPAQGEVLLNGRNLAGQRPYAICRSGIAYVPESRDIFLNLTVDENLAMGAQRGPEGATKWTVEQMFDYFPRLKERRNTRAGNLSGGEQQMLTMCRTLMGDPDLIMVDEPTEGLSPMMVEKVGQLLERIAERGVAILLVEQKLTIAMKISHRLYVMGHGQMVFEGTPQQLQADAAIRKEWLEV